jgi:hypothetical protein
MGTDTGKSDDLLERSESLREVAGSEGTPIVREIRLRHNTVVTAHEFICALGLECLVAGEVSL